MKLSTLARALFRPQARYESIWLRLLVAFIVNLGIMGFGNYKMTLESYFEMKYWIKFTYSLAAAVFIVEMNYWIVILLDRYLPWKLKFELRLATHFLLCVPLPLYADFVYYKWFFAMRGYSIWKTMWPYLYAPTIFALLCGLMFYYYWRYIRHHTNTKEAKRKEEDAKREEAEARRLEEEANSKKLTTKATISLISLVGSIDNIVHLYAEEKKIFAVLKNGKSIPTEYNSLVEISASQGRFIQISRYDVVEKTNIAKVEFDKVRRIYIITLKVPKNGEYTVEVSRELSQTLRAFFKPLVGKEL